MNNKLSKNDLMNEIMKNTYSEEQGIKIGKVLNNNSRRSKIKIKKNGKENLDDMINAISEKKLNSEKNKMMKNIQKITNQIEILDKAISSKSKLSEIKIIDRRLLS